jgi:hypothetical protein
MCVPKTGRRRRNGGIRDRGAGSLKGWGKEMTGKIREAIVVGGLLSLLAVGIVFF